MKFLSLEIENIASLKGKHKVNFEDIENYTSVFAITGDTGSGKSTILNCLSLAFYGQNYKKSLNQMDFITLNESKGMVSVCAQLDGEVYKFNWSCRLKKKNGEDLKNPKPKREYFKREKSSWTPIEKTPEEIIKLTFDQFCKTIILNQGDFAKFLTSSFTDRKDILERFYEGINLDKISTVARQNLKLVKEKIALLESKIQGLTHQSESDMDKLELENDVKLKSTVDNELDILVKNLRDNSQVIRDILNTQKTILTSKERILKVKTDLEQITKEHNQKKVALDEINVKVHQFDSKFNEKEPIYRAGIKKKEKIDQLNIQKQRASVEHQKCIESQAKIISRLEETKKNIAEQEKAKDAIKISIKTLNESDRSTIEKQVKEFIKNEQSIQIKKRDLLALTNANEETQKEAESIKEKNKTLHASDIDSKINIIKKRIESVVNLKDEIKDVSHQLHVATKQYSETKERVSVFQKDIKAKKEEISKITADKDKLESEIEHLSTSIKYYDLIESIHECQAETVKKGKCVVCDSPQISKLPKIDTEGLEKRADLKSQKEERSLILRQVEKTCENLKGKLSTLDTENQIQLQKYKELDDLIKKLQSKISSKNSNQDDVKSLKDLENKLESLNKTKNETEFNNKQIEALRNKFKQTKEKLTELYKNLELEIKSQDEIIKLTNKISNSELTPENLLLEVEKMNKKEVILEQIKTLNKVIISTTEELDNLSSQIVQKKTFESECLTEIDLLKASIKSTCESSDPEAMLSNLIKSKDDIYHQKEKFREAFSAIEIKKADASSRFKNYKEQIESSKDLINSTIVDLDFKVPAEIIDKYKYAILVSFKNLKTYDQINFDSLAESFESLKEYNHSIEQKKKFNKDDLVRQQTKLDQLVEIEKKMGTIEKELESLVSERNQLSDLYDIVGADQFRNFVLSNIEKNLIDQTNIELGKLCDERYQIIQLKKNAKSTPEFHIIDRYKAGLNRKITTLSGGETFMVSLAMALALSELTRGTREIDTLFIDEGFGTLDDESLEDVIEMLLSMSNRGKTVGLITHVKKLSQRIAVNLHLQKSQQGNSTIDLKFQ